MINFAQLTVVLMTRLPIYVCEKKKINKKKNACVYLHTAVASVQLLILKTFVKINLIISICVLPFCSALEACIFNETKQERLRYDIRRGDKSECTGVTMYDA